MVSIEGVFKNASATLVSENNKLSGDIPGLSCQQVVQRNLKIGD